MRSDPDDGTVLVGLKSYTSDTMFNAVFDADSPLVIDEDGER
jgi:hypothetical protein